MGKEQSTTGGGGHHLRVRGSESQTQLCREATLWPLSSHTPSLDYSSVISDGGFQSLNVLNLPFIAMKTSQETESRFFSPRYLFYRNRTQLCWFFHTPVKYTEKWPGIFQFTVVKTAAKGKVPSEVIQKINCDSEIDEWKSYCIPEARPPRNQLKIKGT